MNMQAANDEWDNSINVSVVYEDNDVVIVNKPAGLVVHPARSGVHPDGKTKEPTLVDWLLEKYPAIIQVGEPLVLTDGTTIKRPGIVHRLDRETSGVLIIAKNQQAFFHLKKQFQKREIRKIYNAFVWGEVKESEGVINRPIGKSKKDFRLRSAQRGARGELREAVTRFRVLKKNREFSFVEVSPETGRTHQIRVHFKAVNHPIVCDRLYAPKRECALGFDRLALHALSLTFTSLEGNGITAAVALPTDFEQALSAFK